MNDKYEQATKEDFYKEMIRLHRQRVFMACVIRATQPRSKDDDPSLVTEIIAELGHYASNIKVENIGEGALYIEVPHDVKDDVMAALTDYLSAGGSW